MGGLWLMSSMMKMMFPMLKTKVPWFEFLVATTKLLALVFQRFNATILTRSWLGTVYLLRKALSALEDSHMASFAVNLNWTRSIGILLIQFWIVLLVVMNVMIVIIVMIANFHRTL